MDSTQLFEVYSVIQDLYVLGRNLKFLDQEFSSSFRVGDDACRHTVYSTDHLLPGWHVPPEGSQIPLARNNHRRSGQPSRRNCHEVGPEIMGVDDIDSFATNKPCHAN